jgi:hypothetical protein
MQSILARARSADIVSDPFPHMVIQDALEPRYYEQLAAEFPAAHIILNGREPISNKNFRYAANDVLDDDRISPRWREFVKHHVSQAFFDEVVGLWGMQLRMLYPELETSACKPLADWKSSVRFREPNRDIALECQFAYGAPVKERSRCIGPHVDREVALFAGLFYMRDDADDSEGGDLELYEFKGRPTFEIDSRRVPDENVTCFRSIRYAKNTLVFLLHSPKSLHGVSPRNVTTFPRRHINFVGELTKKVFDVTSLSTIKPTTFG